MKPILVIAELENENIRPGTLELVSAARRLQDLVQDDSPEILILVPAEHPMESAGKIAKITGCRTLGVHWPVAVTPESLKQGLVHIIEDIHPSYLLFSHTTMGRETAPALGARLKSCTISGVTDMGDRDGVVFTRPVMDNTRDLLLHPSHGGLCILTLVPGAFGGGDEKDASRPGEVLEIRLPWTCLDLVVNRRSMTGGDSGNQEIKGAKIIVGVGQGIGDRENLDKVRAFAAELPCTSVGASRPLVDRGWVNYSRQVGITGATVTPDLYIACGISGSSQHLAGMAGSKWVVSINKNPQAPICRHSDLCIQADLMEFIDMFLELE